MNTTLLGRLLMSFVLLASVAAVIGFQWDAEHIFNPDWHPHARLHVVQDSFFVGAMSALGFWLLWRRSLEPRITRLTVAVIPLAGLGATLLAPLTPGISLSPDLSDPNTFQLAGITVYGNIFFSVLMIVLTVTAYFLMAREPRQERRTGEA